MRTNNIYNSRKAYNWLVIDLRVAAGGKQLVASYVHWLYAGAYYANRKIPHYSILLFPVFYSIIPTLFPANIVISVKLSCSAYSDLCDIEA